MKHSRCVSSVESLDIWFKSVPVPLPEYVSSVDQLNTPPELVKEARKVWNTTPE